MTIKEILKSRSSCVREKEELLKCGVSENDKHIRELNKKIVAADKFIYSVTDDKLRFVLVCKFIKNMTEEEISEEMFYCVRHIRRLFRRAMEELEKKNGNR